MFVLLYFYLFATAIFSFYNILEINSLHKQYEISRDKNAKNSTILLSRECLSNIKNSWMWPFLVVKSFIAAFKWIKTS